MVKKGKRAKVHKKDGEKQYVRFRNFFSLFGLLDCAKSDQIIFTAICLAGGKGAGSKSA